MRPRTLADAGLDGPALLTFKADARSAVWRVETLRGPVVVKRFEYAPLRQWLGLLAGIHPAQREVTGNARLRRAGIGVVPIVDAGAERWKGGRRAWLATEGAGTSLYRILARSEPDLPEPGPAVDAAAVLAGALIRAGLWFRDLKPSNIVIDAAGVARLIDACSVRRAGGRARAERMLAVMDRSMVRHGFDAALRQRFERVARAAAGVLAAR